MLRFRLITLVLVSALLPVIGCSSMGLSLFPSGSFLTDQAEAVLEASPREANLAKELDQGVLAAHFLQPGDVLLIEPIDLDTDVRIPADQKVLADGSVDLGGYGRVIVAGFTLEAAEDLISTAVEAAGEERIAVNVRLLEPVHRYYVLGEVNSPGSYPLEGYETVLDGILAGGGLTTAAAPCRLLLARPTPPGSCRVTLPICYREITQMGDTSTNYQLQPGDRIYVASRGCCDEWKFWSAGDSCERCCKCQSACPTPEIAAWRNPMTRVVRQTLAPPVSPTGDENDSAATQDRLDSGGLEWQAVQDQPDTTRIDSPDAPAETIGPGQPSAADGELDFGSAGDAEFDRSDRFKPMSLRR